MRHRSRQSSALHGHCFVLRRSMSAAAVPHRRAMRDRAPIEGPCPICGKLFNLKELQMHADRCARKLDAKGTCCASVTTRGRAPWHLGHPLTSSPPPHGLLSPLSSRIRCPIVHFVPTSYSCKAALLGAEVCFASQEEEVCEQIVRAGRGGSALFAASPLGSARGSSRWTVHGEGADAPEASALHSPPLRRARPRSGLAGGDQSHGW